MENGRDHTVMTVTAMEDLIDKIGQFSSFSIAGRVYSADWLMPQLIVNSAELVTESSLCAAQMFNFARAAVQARALVSQVNASYRIWRDRAFIEEKASTERKVTDEMAKSLYRQRSEYGDWQTRIREAQSQAELAEALQEAFRLKAELIKDQQRILHDEAGGSYVIVEDIRRGIPRQPQIGDQE